MVEIDRHKLKTCLAGEEARFIADHPRSRELFERAGRSLLGGVPMPWMEQWSTPFPIFTRAAKGALLRDVDGNEYLDFCMGDSGALAGHGSDAVVETIRDQARDGGITTMLPSEDSIWVAEELARRYGLPYWQIAMTSTDANRFAVRLARHITGRKRILVFNGCYHGTLAETMVVAVDGRVSHRPGTIGMAVEPSLTTRVVEFNDIPALEEALSIRDLACVLAEPVMTCAGIIHPEPDFHKALREITRRTGTLLILDETHTLCAGPGGYSRLAGLEPDMLVIGKPIAGGIPIAAYGFSSQVAEWVRAKTSLQAISESIDPDVEPEPYGVGGTLTGYALALATARATLEHVLTSAAFNHMIAIAERIEGGIDSVIQEYQLPWHVTRVGFRVEYLFYPGPPRNAAQIPGADMDLYHFMHLYALNRGVLITPFHNVAMVPPQMTGEDGDRFVSVFRDSVAALLE